MISIFGNRMIFFGGKILKIKRPKNEDELYLRYLKIRNLHHKKAQPLTILKIY